MPSMGWWHFSENNTGVWINGFMGSNLYDSSNSEPGLTIYTNGNIRLMIPGLLCLLGAFLLLTQERRDTILGAFFIIFSLGIFLMDMNSVGYALISGGSIEHKDYNVIYGTEGDLTWGIGVGFIVTLIGGIIALISVFKNSESGGRSSRYKY